MAKKSRIVRFTCASANDPLDCTTVTAKRLGINDVDSLHVKIRRPGSNKTVTVHFYANRANKDGLVSTYRSTNWPANVLPVPDVGEPVELEVVSIS